MYRKPNTWGSENKSNSFSILQVKSNSYVMTLLLSNKKYVITQF